MPESARFYVNGFVLKVFNSAYLVVVKPANGETGRYQKFSQLPEWVFRSSHSIWISDEEAPLMIRAMKGDEIKKQIMRSYENNERLSRKKPALHRTSVMEARS